MNLPGDPNPTEALPTLPNPLKYSQIADSGEIGKIQKNQKIIYETPDQPPFKAADMLFAQKASSSHRGIQLPHLCAAHNL